MNTGSLERAPAKHGWGAYHRITRSATYGFLMALPLLVLYEGLILLANQGQVGVRLSAEIWMKRTVALVGGAGLHMLGALVLAVGLAIFFYERRKRLPLRARYFGWMVAESAVYAVVLTLIVSTFVGALFAAAASMGGPPLRAVQAAAPGFWTQLALSIGAGLYEELLFRVLLVGGLFLVLRRVFTGPVYAYALAALVGALLFSAVHYVGALGDVFTVPSFTYRFLFGLALNAVFLLRGFGVAAWTHALYDVMIVTGLLG